MAGLLPLAACDETTLPGVFQTSGAEPAAQSAPARETGSVRVVEAPDVFDVSEEALWDGRPSLGLVWVAYEGADPTNVLIRNEETGAFVVGALYRRERFFPGPPFQLSSDAAAELGILAGNPTRIRVTALVEEAVVAEEPAPIPAPEISDEVPGALDGDPVDTADISAPQEDDVLPAPAASEVSASLDPIAAAAAAIEAADPVPAGEIEAIPSAPPPRPITQGPNAPQPRQNSNPPPVIEETIAVNEPEITSEPIQQTFAAPSSAVTTLNRPFIQVGIFSVQDNAQRTAEGLSRAGILPFVEEQRVGGRDFYRVIVGPATDSAERQTLLEAVQAQGFTDAYFVKN